MIVSFRLESKGVANKVSSVLIAQADRNGVEFVVLLSSCITMIDGALRIGSNFIDESVDLNSLSH